MGKLAFALALRASILLTRFALYVEYIVLTAPSDETFDEVMKGIGHE